MGFCSCTLYYFRSFVKGQASFWKLFSYSRGCRLRARGDLYVGGTRKGRRWLLCGLSVLLFVARVVQDVLQRGNIFLSQRESEREREL